MLVLSPHVEKDKAELLDLLRAQVTRLGTARKVAQSLRMTESRLGRVLNQVDTSFSVLACLRLSELSGEPPSRVLRAGGHHDEAELIERLYDVGKAPVSPSERALLDRWERLNTRSRESVMTIIDQLAGTRGAKGSTKKTA